MTKKKKKKKKKKRKRKRKERKKKKKEEEEEEEKEEEKNEDGYEEQCDVMMVADAAVVHVEVPNSGNPAPSVEYSMRDSVSFSPQPAARVARVHPNIIHTDRYRL